MAKGKRREELRPSVAPGGLLLPAHTESTVMQQLQRHSGGPDTPFRGWTGFVSSLLDTAGAVVDAAINRATQLLARNEEREGGAAVMHEAMGKDLKDEAVMKELVERFEVLDDGEDAALLPSVSGGGSERRATSWRTTAPVSWSWRRNQAHGHCSTFLAGSRVVASSL